jgi:ubiquinone biosynthesis protein COQ9
MLVFLEEEISLVLFLLSLMTSEVHDFRLELVSYYSRVQSSRELTAGKILCVTIKKKIPRVLLALQKSLMNMLEAETPKYLVEEQRPPKKCKIV